MRGTSIYLVVVGIILMAVYMFASPVFRDIGRELDNDYSIIPEVQMFHRLLIGGGIAGIVLLLAGLVGLTVSFARGKRGRGGAGSANE